MIFEINHFESVESSNDIAGKMAKEGAPEGSVILAEEQTAGRGRFKRAWVSDRGKGLWFSLILRPKLPLEKVAGLTMVAGLAVALAVEKQLGERLAGERILIKWPNDLLLDGRKLCGILSEAAFDKGRVSHVIVGIGLNLKEPTGGRTEGNMAAGFLESITGQEIDRDRLLDEILKSFALCYGQWQADSQTVLAEIKKRSATLGQKVDVNTFNGIFSGRAIDIDETGALLVEGQGGELRKFNSGEVSLRKNLEDNTGG